MSYLFWFRVWGGGRHYQVLQVLPSFNCFPMAQYCYKPVMNDSDSGIGFNSGISHISTGIGINNIQNQIWL